MNSIFKLDGPVFTILNKFCDILILSILWMLFSLPVVTLGASSAALYHSVHKVLLNGEGYVFSTFWNSFRTNLKQGVLLTLILIPLAIFVVISWFFSDGVGRTHILGIIYFAVSILCALLFLILLTTIFPLLSRFYMTIPNLLKATIALGITRIGFTLMLIVIFLMCASAFLVAPVTGFVLPACFAMAAERILEPGFKKLADASQTNESETV